MNTQLRPGIFKRHLQVTSHRGRASSDFPIRKLEAATRACDCNVEWLTIEFVDDRSAGTNYDTGNVGAVPLSRETGFSPWEEGRDTKVVLRDSRYGLRARLPSPGFVAAICAPAWVVERRCAALDAGVRN